MFQKLLWTSCLVAISYFSQAQLRITNAGGTLPLGFNTAGGVAEITAFDPITKQLFCINGNTNQIAVYNFSNPSPTLMSPVQLISISGAGSINSIACYRGLLAVVYENATDRTQAGAVQLYTTTGMVAIGSPITVGAQPDMITFTPNGRKLLIANEGEPNDFYTVDPEGSVSIIDVANPQFPVTAQVVFTSLNGTIPHLATVTGAMPSIRIFGMKNSLETTNSGFALSNVKTRSTVAEDLEPEYITVSADNNTAWVTCQENNAVLIINLTNNSLTTIVGLGYKDHNTVGNGMDISRTPTTSTSVNFNPLPFKGMYQPDGISVSNIGGVNYLFTANEGDARAYAGFNEELNINASFFTRINNGANPTVNGIITASGIRITNTMGNTNGGNAFMDNSVAGTNINVGNNFEDLYTYGARSFSIWNGATGALVWDSGDDLERKTFAAFPNNFNADHNGASGNNVRWRSTTKGPEPESIVSATIGDSVYAFIGLERIGGVMVYNVTNPNAPFFKQYLNTRSFTLTPIATNSATGNDLGPEGLTLIKAEDSPNGLPYLVVSNEISGTVRIFALENKIVQNRTVFLSIPASQTVSGVQLLTLSGTGVPSPLTFVAPVGFEVSLANTTGFGSSILLNHSGSLASSQVFVRYTGTMPYTTGFVTVTGAGMAIPQIQLAGENLKFAQSDKSSTSSQSSYLYSTVPGAKFTAMMTVGDQVGGYAFCGIPDGVGAYDNNNGTFTMLINHEMGNTAGVVRAHGGRGAFVSKWVIDKTTLAVQSGSDLIQNVNLFNATTTSYTTYNATNTIAGLAMARFCSADLPAVSAYYNSVTGLGTQERIFMNGEETGPEGRGFAHIATGTAAGVSYELPRSGKCSFENIVANPFSQDKTISIGLDDAGGGQIYMYVGTKTNSGNPVERAGLTNGKLFGLSVTGLVNESNTPVAKTTFGMYDFGNVETMTGAALQTMSVNNGVTGFLRPEDGAWDPQNLNTFYFLTTNAFNAPSRMWKMVFYDITSPELGGTIEHVLDGTEGQQMMDNITVDNHGHALIVEDVGGNAHIGRVLQYDIVSDKLTTVGLHDPIRFSTLGGANLLTIDEEASGIIDVQEILGQGMFLVVDQAHYPQPGALVEGGQMLAFFNPDTFKGRTPSVTVTSANLTSGGANFNLNTLVTSNATGTKSYTVTGANASVTSMNMLAYFDAGVVTVSGMIASITGFKSAMFTTTVTIVKQNATATFAGSTLTIGGATLDVSTLFNTNSNGTKMFTISGTAATLAGNNITLTAVEAGTVTISGNVATSAAFNESAIVSAVFTVVKQNPSLTFAGAVLTIGGATLDITNLLTCNSTGTKSFSVNGTAATLSGTNILTGVASGTVTITGMVESTTGFNAGMAMAMFTIVKQNPSITFTGGSLTVGGSTLDITNLLSRNSTGTKSFSVNGTAATLSGTNILTGVASGTVTITGMVESTTGFNAGMAMAIFTVISVPIPIVQVNPSITFTGATLTIGGANVNLATLFSTNSTGTPSFVINGTSASIAGTNLIALSAGTVTVTSSVTSTVGFNAASKTAVFTIVAGNSTSLNTASYQSTNLVLYPNPVAEGILYFNKTITGIVYNIVGIKVMEIKNVSSLDVSKLTAGKYMIKTSNGETRPFVVK